MGFPTPENKLIADEEIHDTGQTHSQKIAQHHIPSGKFPDQQQHSKAQEKHSRTRQVVGQKQLEEAAFT